MSATSPPPRTRFDPTPIEETVKKVRKFAVEPVETTTRSNKKENIEQVENAVEKKDFAAAPPKRRFLPQPVETTQKSSKAKSPSPLPTPELAPESKSQAPAATDSSAPRRRFTPQLIETSKRFKRSTTPGPATLPTDKTDITPVCSAVKFPLITRYLMFLGYKSYLCREKTKIHTSHTSSFSTRQHASLFFCRYPFARSTFTTASATLNAPSQ